MDKTKKIHGMKFYLQVRAHKLKDNLVTWSVFSYIKIISGTLNAKKFGIYPTCIFGNMNNGGPKVQKESPRKGFVSSLAAAFFALILP